MGNNIMPNHVAIIPDGNRRWAKQRGLSPWEGHFAGAENTEQLLRKALELGIKCFSVWGSSLDNLKKRPPEESRQLLRAYERYFSKLLKSDDIHKYKVKINFVGRWEEQFPEALKKVLYGCIEATKDYSENMLNFFLAYSGDDEMERAIREIIKKGIPYEEISKETIKENLMTRNLPEVDFMIRTGGEPHLSTGFMMWDTANVQLYFSEKYYPDFGVSEFEDAINDFSQRSRRRGK